MKVSNVCKNYFNGFYEVSRCNKHNNTNTLAALKILSYFTILIPLGFGAVYGAASLYGRINKKGPLSPQDKNINNQAKKTTIQNDQPILKASYVPSLEKATNYCEEQSNDESSNLLSPIGNHTIDIPRISLDDVERVEVDDICRESVPCQHISTVILRDGRQASGANSLDICSIVLSVAEEKINPGKEWSAKNVKKHFKHYSTKPIMGWEVRPPEKVLNDMFSKMTSDVERVEVGDICRKSVPCQHISTVFLRDGRQASGANSLDICSIVLSVAEEKINPGKEWSAKNVKKHFKHYSTKPIMGWEVRPPEKVLNDMFSEMTSAL